MGAPAGAFRHYREGEGEVVLFEGKIPGSAFKTIVSDRIRYFGTVQGMPGIGHGGTLHRYRIDRIVQIRHLVEGEVEGGKDEIVHQYVFPTFDDAVPKDLYAVLPVALGPPEHERPGDAAVFIGRQLQTLEFVAPGVLQYCGHLLPGFISLDGVTPAVQDSLEEHGLVGLESRTVG